MFCPGKLPTILVIISLVRCSMLNLKDMRIGASILATKMTNCGRLVLSGPRFLSRLLKVDRKEVKVVKSVSRCK